MSDSLEPRRRTSFEKDMREFLAKVVLGVVVAVVLRAWTETDGWLGPLAIGLIAVFFLASVIRGSSRDAD